MYSEEQLKQIVDTWNECSLKVTTLDACINSLKKRINGTYNAGYTAEQVQEAIINQYHTAGEYLGGTIYDAVKKCAVKAALSEQPQPQPAEQPQPQADTLTTLIVNAARPYIDSAIKSQIEHASATGAIEKPLVIVTQSKKITTQDKHECFSKVLDMLANHCNVYLCGPAGTGKNVIATQCAEALNLKFYYDNSIMDEYKIKGYMDASGRFIDTPFYHAFKEGGLYMLDELDCSDQCASKALNAALANGYYTFANGEQVKAHEDFYCIAAGNTYGTGCSSEYTAGLTQDASLLNRFETMYVDYSPRIEDALAPRDIVNFCRDFRRACAECGIQHVVSYRNIIALSKLSAMWADDLKSAVYSAVIKELSADDIGVIMPHLNHSNKYTQAIEH